MSLLVISTLFSNCLREDDYSNKDELIFEFDKENFEKHRTLWLEQNAQNYDFKKIIRSSSFGELTYKFEVRDGIATNATDSLVSAYTFTELYQRIENTSKKYLDPDYKPKGREHYSLYVEYDKEKYYIRSYSFTTYNAPPGGGGYSVKYEAMEIYD